MELENNLSSSPQQKQSHKKSRLSEFMDENLSDSDEDEEKDEYVRWKNERCEKDVTNPIAYWWSKRELYPRLSHMALDVFGIPAMSSEPERVFSVTGNMVRPN